MLKAEKYKVNIIFGSMERDERDEYIEKFRRGEIQVVITTDLLSRGFDMPTIQLVINFDVPLQDGKPDFETYMHRIGRAGRFGTPGLAVTIYDREQDEKAFWDIIKHYTMQEKVHKLEGGPNQIASLLDGLTEKGMD